MKNDKSKMELVDQASVFFSDLIMVILLAIQPP
jgi:hypothetical protein